MLVYVASSWRNRYQPGVVALLRELGHEVYDFRNSEPGNHGFSWSAIDPDWRSWTPAQYREALRHPVAERGYALDAGAVRRCDVGLLVLPAGRSASWELGHVMGRGKPGYVYVPEPVEPDLMFREATVLVSEDELREAFGGGQRSCEPEPAVVGDHFVLFEVFEDGERVGKVALCMAWTKADVLVELDSRRYPTREGTCIFEGWPSSRSFKIVNARADGTHTFTFCGA